MTTTSDRMAKAPQNNIVRKYILAKAASRFNIRITKKSLCYDSANIRRK